MYADIDAREGEIPWRFKNECSMTFRWLLGGVKNGVYTSDLRKLWRISGTAVSKMYWKAIHKREDSASFPLSPNLGVVDMYLSALIDPKVFDFDLPQDK